MGLFPVRMGNCHVDDCHAICSQEDVHPPQQLKFAHLDLSQAKEEDVYVFENCVGALHHSSATMPVCYAEVPDDPACQHPVKAPRSMQEST